MEFCRLFGQAMAGSRLTLVDVGAAGHIQARWSRVAPHLNYVGFEPDDRSRLELVRTNQGCTSNTIVETALSDQSTPLRLNLCRKPTVSSSLDPNAEWLRRFPDAHRFDVLEVVDLPATALDDLQLGPADFIKLNVQGGELAVLKGGVGLLAGCVGVEVEVEFVPVYRKEPLFGDVSALLAGQGLEFIDFVSLNRWGRFGFDEYGQAVFEDAPFLRPPEKFVLAATAPHDRMRYLGVCILYNRFDLIRRLSDVWDGPALAAPAAAAIASLEARFKRARRLTSLSMRAARYRLGAEFDLNLIY